MNQESLKQKYKERDRAVRALSKDGKFRIISLKNTLTAKTAQERHKLPDIPALFLARAMSAAMMYAAMMKGEERIIVEAEGKGPMKKVSAEAVQTGEVRGFAVFSEDIKGGADSISEFFGEGSLRVIKILYDRAEPLTSIIPLRHGDISTDMAYYFKLSEQISSAIILDVDFDDNGIIRESAGFLVQAMPHASEKEIETIVNTLMNIDKLSGCYKTVLHPEQIIEKILPLEFEVLKTIPVDFFCRCSKESFVSRLLTLEYNDIKEMHESGQNELVCRYCNEKYYLDDTDFNRLLLEKTAEAN